MNDTIGRNDPCHCGSKKKYKKCHLEKDEVKKGKERTKASLNASEVAMKKKEKEKEDGGKASHEGAQKQSWLKSMTKKVFFRRGRGKR